ncbi:MAG: hypothetical protein WCX73_02550 [Candidatus Pacearchaeota archaeon]|jgi:hypothetical protein
MKNQTLNFRSKTFYYSRDIFRNVEYFLFDKLPEVLIAELNETKVHFKDLKKIFIGELGSNFRSGITGVMLYDAIHTVNKYGVSIGYRGMKNSN